MISLIRTTIQELVAPDRRLSCQSWVWSNGLAELRRRGNGQRESGAFLLGRTQQGKRRIERFVYYDDLDSNCLNTGIVIIDGSKYGPLWQKCSESSLSVVADIHTHMGTPRQSDTDRRHPMIAISGHIALIVPNFAKRAVTPIDLGIYEYQGSHLWKDYSGSSANKYFYIGLWG